MTRWFFHTFTLLLMLLSAGYAGADSTVTNIRWYRISDERVAIYYELVGDEQSAVTVMATYEQNGETRTIQPTDLTGDIGPMSPGRGYRIIWNIAGDLPYLPETFTVTVTTAGVSIPIPYAGDTSDVIHATRITEPIRLDGILDEPAWRSAVTVTGFTQREPDEGVPATDETEVWFLYDDDTLYIGAICHDSEPEKIIHKELKWDGNIGADDAIAFIIDTYHDRRTGYFISLNPNGAQSDATFEVGKGSNYSWDGIWETSARITNRGWEFEIAIPFKTLRFPNTDVQTWGINVSRTNRRKNEQTLWKSWRRNEGNLDITRIGSLVMDTRVSSGTQIDAKPFALGGIEQIQGRDMTDVFKYGLDLQYGITSNTTLDLTTRTDFAQVESDREVINLTRFDVRYPEKRDFFLEGREYFDFAYGGTNLFYSRRIGISPDRRQLPILGGAKLTQKSGSFRMGLLSMQTEAEYGFPSTNYSVLRLKKDVLDQSYVGMIATSVLDTEDHDNQTYGVDFGYQTTSFLGDRNLRIMGYGTSTVDDGSSNHAGAWRLEARYPNDLLDTYLVYEVNDENFNPGVGFQRRTGIVYWYWSTQITPRPGIPGIRKLVFSPLDIMYYTYMDGKLFTRTFRTEPFGFITNSGDTFDFTLNYEYEDVDRPFNIFRNTVIPQGGYDWMRYALDFQTSRSRPVAFGFSTGWGDYMNGDRTNYSSSLTWKSNQYYSLSADMNYNSIAVANDHFITREYGGRLQVDLSTRLFTSTFIQWNNQSRQVNANFRIQYIPKIGSHIFIVYNHVLDESDDFETMRYTAMLKLDYTYRF